MSNPYAAVYPPGPGHSEMQQPPIATAPPPGMFPMPMPQSQPQPQPHPNAAVMPQGKGKSIVEHVYSVFYARHTQRELRLSVRFGTAKGNAVCDLDSRCDVSARA